MFSLTVGIHLKLQCHFRNMNFIKRLFISKKDYDKIDSDWNKQINKAYKAVSSDKLKYPIIMLCDVLWDFSVYKSHTELISESIAGHWGLNEHFTPGIHESDTVIDSNGNKFKFNHKHYDKVTGIGFSYPSEFITIDTIENIKERIISGCKDFIECYSEESKVKNVENKIEIVKKINTIQELILYTEKELNFFP
ncbi:hypothetical protein [Tenacibaculum sp. M341]|uniref:hypothetical protein n=1 Tax=Tenacibaculum sp. M341 TaxID=2530339 RepID=UPI001053553D|nr:hypothetical protein [Tenacibaculum sp. M341]TCI90947.1 hypothetical protein EYW44_11370 [Tenacibaculum sp. M341]